jgi:GTP:adenosylcobinamide-phosphate guanylyltransferase
MIELSAIDLHWLEKSKEEEDSCVHGRVRFYVNDKKFVDQEDGDFSVATAALYLLRSLERDHVTERSITSDSHNMNLFPECGFTVWSNGVGDTDIVVMGCENGMNCEVRHKENAIDLNNGKETVRVAEDEWHAAVVGFASKVLDFYRSAKPKVYADDLDREGWMKFWNEFNDRLSRA